MSDLNAGLEARPARAGAGLGEAARRGELRLARDGPLQREGLLLLLLQQALQLGLLPRVEIYLLLSYLGQVHRPLLLLPLEEGHDVPLELLHELLALHLLALLQLHLLTRVQLLQLTHKLLDLVEHFEPVQAVDINVLLLQGVPPPLLLQPPLSVVLEDLEDLRLVLGLHLADGDPDHVLQLAVAAVRRVQVNSFVPGKNILQIFLWTRKTVFSKPDYKSVD